MTIGEQIIAYGGITIIFFLGIAVCALCIVAIINEEWLDYIWKGTVSVCMLTITITIIIWLWYH